MHQRGFTLIEILVVLVIISVIVSMAAINTGNDPRIKELSAEAQRLRFVLEDLSEQALFRNTDIGFVANKSEISFYEYIATPANPNNLNQEETFTWQLSQQKVSNPFKLTQESMTLSLSVEGLSVVLPFSGTQDDKEIEPQFFAYSSGEQDVTLFEISIDDLERVSTVKGMGVGRYYTGVKDEP